MRTLRILLKTTLLLGLVASWLGAGPLLRATVIFDNSANDLVTRFDPGTNEVGDEIILAGTERYLTNFSFEYWGTNSTGTNYFSGYVEARVRFYQNNGPLFNGYPSPGTNFYDSGWFSIVPTPRSTLNFLSGHDFACSGLFLPVTSNMTWSVQFRGMDVTDSVGVDLYSPPVVGQDYPDYWLNTGGSWMLRTNSSGVNVDFAAKMQATGINPNPPLLTSSTFGNFLLLSWPGDRIGWKLQVQTNSTQVGISNNWYTIEATAVDNHWVIPIDSTLGCVFTRLIYSPVCP